MRKLIFLAAFLPGVATAQYSGPTYNPANVHITGGTAAFTGTVSTTGNLNVQGSVNSTQNTNPASTTNSGVALTAAPNVADVVFYDSTKATDNHIAELIWFQGCLQSRFKSDSQSSAVAPLAVCGGYASGITGIASNTGSGSWTNTGPFGVTQAGGNGILLTPSANGGAPTLATNGANSNVSLNISTQGGGGINLNSSTAVTGNLSLTGTLTSYNSIATTANGVPILIASSAKANQAADVGNTALATVPASGLYRVSVYQVCTQAATTSSTIPTVAVDFTDADTGVVAPATVGGTLTSNLKGAYQQSSIVISAQQGSTIQWSTSGYASSGATPMQFTVRVLLEYLGG
jgi:hypothetical protein